MGVTIREVIEHGGYDLTTLEDSTWLLAQRNMWDELVEEMEELVELYEEYDDYVHELEIEDEFNCLTFEQWRKEQKK